MNLRSMTTAMLVLVAATLLIAQPGIAPSHPVDNEGGDEAAPIRVTGIVTDAATGKPLAGVSVHAWGERTDPDTGESHGTGKADDVSDADGRFLLELGAGTIHLYAWHGPGLPYEATFVTHEDVVHDVAMKPYPPKEGSLSGTVVDAKTGEPVDGAVVDVSRYYGSEQDSVIVPSYANEEGSVLAGPDGTFEIMLYGGHPYAVRAWREGFLWFYRVVDVGEGSDVKVEVTMKKIPPPSVTVTGRVIDAETGQPVPGAYVDLENAEWQQYVSGTTDADGRYDIRTWSGYTRVWISTDSGYPFAFDGAEPATMDCSEESDCEPNPYAAVIGPDANTFDGQFRARVCCLPAQGGKYDTWVTTRVFEADSHVELDAKLTPRVTGSATVLGWIIDDAAETGIKGAYLSLQNEDTGEWGYVEADQDGSFKLAARPGHHVVYAYAAGYFWGVLAVEVRQGENELVVRLVKDGHGARPLIYYPPGSMPMEEAPDGSYASDSQENATKAGAPQDGARLTAEEQEAAVERALADRLGADGEATYASLGGGLGAYDPNAEFGETETPGFPLVAGLAAVVLAALRRRRVR